MPRTVEFMPPVSLSEYFGFPRGRSDSFGDVTLTFRGRDATALACSHFGLEADDLVLLPGYICDTVPAGFGACGRFRYYDLREDFTIDPTIIKSSRRS